MRSRVASQPRCVAARRGFGRARHTRAAEGATSLAFIAGAAEGSFLISARWEEGSRARGRPHHWWIDRLFS